MKNNENDCIYDIRNKPEYAFIKNAFDKIESDGIICTGTNKSINLSAIIDKLMTDTGRFCEQYLGDLLITWDSAKELIAKDHTENDEYYISFGIRRQGVDSNSFITARMSDESFNANDYYRKLFVLKVTATPHNDVICELKSVMSELAYEYKKQTRG